MTHLGNPAFQPVDARPDFPAMEERTLRFWKDRAIFQAVRAKMDGAKPFVFLDGPPTANGMPHVGHALTRAVKDAFLRYKAMDGFTITPWIAGWDCHGLPVELEVEKALGIESKDGIVQYGVERFNAECKKSVFKYKGEWAKMDERIALWMDFEHPYVTMTEPYIESVWWSLSELWKKGLLEKGHYVVPYCPRCGTPLSSHEVAQGYDEVKDNTVFVRFKLADEPNTFVLAWTTTPWTLISNLMLAVGEDVEYSLVEYKGERYYLSSAAMERVFKSAMKYVELLGVVKGRQLVGKKYLQLLPFVKVPEPSLFITHAPFVTTEEGTGVVHIAPAYGIDDFELCRARGVGMVNPVDEKGRFRSEVVPWAGQFVKDADKSIIQHLEKEGILFDKGTITHTYPFCWRCDSPLLYYALDSWFVRMSKLKEQMVANNERVTWKPEHLKHGRFGNFLGELKDWALSRNRFWGTPLPVWVCSADKNHMHCVGSKAELASMATAPLPADFELHRPWVDRVVLKCPKCGSDMKREDYVIDTWYDSGSAFFAQYHYPFENKAEFESHYPVDFITEAIDQTRGWFYTMLAVSTAVFGKPAYMSVLTLGLTLDENGQKMSKSRGNAVSPTEAFARYGADTVRLYLYSTPAWDSTKYSHEQALDVQKKTLGTLWNVYYFFVNNARLDGFVPTGKLDSANPLDRWLVSRVQGVADGVRTAMDSLELHVAYREFADLTDDLSTWYLRRSRTRFWAEGMTPEKRAAYETLHYALATLSRLMAPFAPYFAEELYQTLVRRGDASLPESVHLTAFPHPFPEYRDHQLESRMRAVIRAAEAGRHARQKVNLKLRQPLSVMYVAGPPGELEALEPLMDILRDEMNVKEVRPVTDTHGLMDPVVKLNFASAGKKLKSEANKVKQALEGMDPRTLLADAEKGILTVLGHPLATEDLSVDWVERKGLSLGQADALTVAVDTHVDENLKHEGLAREIIRRIQMMRKELDLGYDAHIRAFVDGPDEISPAIELHGASIASETLCDSLVRGKGSGGLTKEWDVEGLAVTITVVQG